MLRQYKKKAKISTNNEIRLYMQYTGIIYSTGFQQYYRGAFHSFYEFIMQNA